MWPLKIFYLCMIISFVLLWMQTTYQHKINCRWLFRSWFLYGHFLRGTSNMLMFLLLSYLSIKQFGDFLGVRYNRTSVINHINVWGVSSTRQQYDTGRKRRACSVWTASSTGAANRTSVVCRVSTFSTCGRILLCGFTTCEVSSDFFWM